MTKPSKHAHFWSQQYMQYGDRRATRVFVNRGNSREMVVEGLPLVAGPSVARALQAAYESGVGSNVCVACGKPVGNVCWECA